MQAIWLRMQKAWANKHQHFIECISTMLQYHYDGFVFGTIRKVSWKIFHDLIIEILLQPQVK